jgi:hypothetical protein
VWAGVRGSFLNLLIQREGWGALLCRINLTVDLTDPENSDYLTRVDLRIPEGLLQAREVATEDGIEVTHLYLPFPVPEARGLPDSMYVVTRTTLGIGEEIRRGQSWEILSIANDPITGLDRITVRGDATAAELFVGFKISAERTESEFYVRTPAGVADAERVDVRDHIYGYAKTGYFRAEVTFRLGNQKKSLAEFSGRVLGDPANIMGSYVITNGYLKVPVNKKSNEYSLTLINDSFLPSRWTSCKVHYTASIIAQPVVGRASAGR